MSTHSVDVVEISRIENHPNADMLEIAYVWDYACIVKKGEFKIGTLGVFIEPDYIVDALRPEFSFLASKAKSDGTYRVTTVKLRGVQSYGLLFKAPEDCKLGENVMERFGVKRYEPPTWIQNKQGSLGTYLGGASAKGPEITAPHYDLENYKKYRHSCLEDGEQIMIFSKIHGCGSRYVFHDGKMFVGSRNVWKDDPGLKTYIDRDGVEQTYESKPSAWHMALEQNPWMESWCRENPGMVIYCELFGKSVQGPDFHYSKKENFQYGLAVFDVLDLNGKWIDNLTLHTDEKFKMLEKVPLLFVGPHNREMVAELAELDETFNGCGHIREGVVVKRVKEKWHHSVGRIALKYVSDRYDIFTGKKFMKLPPKND